MTILMLIGLKHYFLLYPDQSHVQLPYLRFLCEKYLLEYDNADSRNSQLSNRQRKLEQLQIQYSDSGRRYRPDSMAHFPFADEHGSIGDVLGSGTVGQEIDLDNMGVPGRNRLILKVFEEMRLDRQGIRISDLPEALERLGIQLSVKLRNTLLKARGKNVNGPLIPKREMDAEPWEYMEKHVPLSLWKSIVKNFLHLRRQGIQPGYLQEVLPSLNPGRAGQRAPTHLKNSNDDDESNEEDEGSIDDHLSYSDNTADENSERVQPHQSRYSGHNEEKVSATNRKRTSKESKFSGNINRPTKSSQQKVNPVQARSRAYFQRLQRVPSRLGDAIRHDRFRHQFHQLQDSKDALSTIASRRVDILTSQAPKLGWKDPAYQYDQLPDSTLKRQGFSHNQVDGRLTINTHLEQSRKQRQQQRNAVKRLQQLDSGAATLEIADAFLQGQVGRELLLDNPRGSEYQDFYGEQDEEDEIEDLSPQEAQKRAAAFLGIPLSKPEAYTARAPGKSESSLQKKINEVSANKALYEGQSGWKGTKGGWVADFGPVHTHNLYSGPDQYTPFLLDRKLSMQSQSQSASNDAASPSPVNKISRQHTMHGISGSTKVGTIMSSLTNSLTQQSRMLNDHRADEADLLFARSRRKDSNNIYFEEKQSMNSSDKVASPTFIPSSSNNNTQSTWLTGGSKEASRKKNLTVSIQDPTSLSSTPSSEDAALYASAANHHFEDDSDDVFVDDESEEDVDALLSRLQSSVSLKDLVANN